MKLSIILPVFNQPELVKRALDSVPFDEDLEVIAVDDHSTDNTVDILKQYPVKLYVLERNMGTNYARNYAIDHASGEYIIGLDDDDYFYTEQLRDAIKELDGTDMVFIDQQVNDGGVFRMDESNKRHYCAFWTKFVRREFIGDTRCPTNVTQKCNGDLAFNEELMAKPHTEKYTGIVAYHYNFPREGSQLWKRDHMMIKNLFFFRHLGMGGTEQFLYEIAKKYSKDHHIAVAYQTGEMSQVVRLSRYVDVIEWHPGLKIRCEKAFLNFHIDIIDDLVCDDITLVDHANFEVIGYTPPVHPRIKRCIAVSEFVREIYSRHFETPCIAVYNPITIEDYERPLILMSAFRGEDPKRGTERCKILSEKLDQYCREHDKRYMWLFFSKKPCVEFESPNVLVIQPRTDVRAYMQLADWGINLPDDMETYGYTNVEFLMYGIPIITTPITVAEELKMDSSMRLILDYDLKNADEIIEQMFTRKMNFKYEPPKDGWDKILAEGEGTVEEKLKVRIFKVKATSISEERGISLSELGRPAKTGEVFETTEDRLDNLVNGNNKWKTPFAVLIEEIKEETPIEEKPKRGRPKKQ